MSRYTQEVCCCCIFVGDKSVDKQQRRVYKLSRKIINYVQGLTASLQLQQGNIWQHLATPGNTWQHLATPGNTWQHLATPGNTWAPGGRLRSLGQEGGGGVGGEVPTPFPPHPPPQLPNPPLFKDAMTMKTSQGVALLQETAKHSRRFINFPASL